MGINPLGYAWLKKSFENSMKLKDCLVNLLPYMCITHGKRAYTSKLSLNFSFYMSTLNASWLERRAGGGGLKQLMTKVLGNRDVKS